MTHSCPTRRSSDLLYIITNAVLFSFLMTSENIPQLMDNRILAQGLGPIAFLLVVNVLLLLAGRSEEHTAELQSLMRTSYHVLFLKKKNKITLNSSLHITTTLHIEQTL